ncbi:MAG: WYL domain-containing protein [Acidobacteriota bacterium]
MELKRIAPSAPSGRGTRRILDSVIHIDRRLRSGSCLPLATLANELEASKRTVQRYVEFLRDRVDAPVEFDRRRRGYRYTDERFVVPAVALSEGELIALYVAGPVLLRYRGTEFGRRIETAFRKIEQYLPDRVRLHLLPIEERIGGKANDVASRDEIERFDLLVKATLSDRRLRIDYYSAHRGAEEEREVDPYALRFVNGEWYLIGFCHTRGSVLTFHVGRVRAAAETGDGFLRPAGFSADAYLADAFGVFRDPRIGSGAGDTVTREVLLKFDAFAARFVREHEWHESQSIAERPDGSIELRMRVTGMVEVERFVLAWGEHAEVLHPADLRTRVASRLRAAGTQYRDVFRNDDTF